MKQPRASWWVWWDGGEGVHRVVTIAWQSEPILDSVPARRLSGERAEHLAAVCNEIEAALCD